MLFYSTLKTREKENMISNTNGTFGGSLLLTWDSDLSEAAVDSKRLRRYINCTGLNFGNYFS